MNANRLISLAAAVLITVGQTLVFATDTASNHHGLGGQVSDVVAHEALAAAGKRCYAAGGSLRFPGWRGV